MTHLKRTIRASAISLCFVFSLGAWANNMQEVGGEKADPVDSYADALVEETETDSSAQSEPLQAEAANCHIAYAAAYEAAARTSWPRTPTLALGSCPDRTGQQVQVVCAPAGRWKDLAAKANASSVYQANTQRADPPLEYTCRLQPPSPP